MSFDYVDYGKAFNSPGKCRFYIDMGMYLHTVGLWNAEYLYMNNIDMSSTTSKKEDFANLFYLNPSSNVKFSPISADQNGTMQLAFPVPPSFTKFDYIALLNHNLFDTTASDGSRRNVPYMPALFEASANGFAGSLTYDNIINASPVSWDGENALDSNANGYSISLFNQWTGQTGQGAHSTWIQNGKPTYFTDEMPNTPVGSNRQSWPNLAGVILDPLFSPEIDLGCISMGYTWETPNTPEMNYTIERSFEGVDKYNTKGGSQLHNIRYTGPPAWGDAAAWQLYQLHNQDPTYGAGQFAYPETRGTRVGRRSWTLEFPAIVQEKMVPAWESFNYLERPFANTVAGVLPGISDGGSSLSPEMQGDDFISCVINRTLGGTLPFIFQWNLESSKQGDFALCRLDLDSFTIKQSAHNIFDLSIKIVETW